MNMTDETKFNVLKCLADKARDKAIEYENLAKVEQTKSQKYTNEAIAMLVPFGLHDIIEYEERFGYKGKTRKARMIVRSFSFWYDSGISVSGRQVNKKNQFTTTGKSFRITKDSNPFIRIIKAKE